MTSIVADQKKRARTKRLSRGMRKHLRHEKARIRNVSHSEKEALEKITSITEHIFAS